MSAVGVSLLAVALTALSSSLTASATFLLPFAAVAMSGWYGGFLGGLVATATTAGVIDVWLLAPSGHWLIVRDTDAIRFGAFLALALATTAFNASLHVAARRIRRSERLARVIVESAPVLITAADDQGRIVMFNEACERATGYRAQDVIGNAFLDTLVPMEWRSRVSTRFSSETEEALAQPHRNPWTTQDGAERLIEWRCYKVPAPEGTMIIGIGADVTEQQRREQQLREAHAAADAAVRAREQFIATLSHELRNPLQVAVGWCELLRREARDPKAVGISEKIGRSYRLIARLIDDTYDLSRITAGKLPVNRTQLLLTQVVQEAVEAFSPACAGRHVTINLDVRGPVLVMGDPDRLYQMVTNLLTNALKFSPDGSHVAVSVRPVDGMAEVSVRDQGPGIEGNDTERVFQPFWQSEGARGGLGLGLTLVNQLAQLHGGSASITRATPEGGTVATFRIPALDPRAEVAAS